jgi:hypothetical protein
MLIDRVVKTNPSCGQDRRPDHPCNQRSSDFSSATLVGCHQLADSLAKTSRGNASPSYRHRLPMTSVRDSWMMSTGYPTTSV